jgi:DNA-binding MarR family transcriptional regulator
MTWKGTTRVAVVDPRRPFTDLTWMLIVIMLDEERRTWRAIAEELHRDPEDVAEKIREGAKRGLLDAVRRDLIVRDMLYARRRARQVALTAVTREACSR